jgi:nucleoid DNA-binding protein
MEQSGAKPAPKATATRGDSRSRSHLSKSWKKLLTLSSQVGRTRAAFGADAPPKTPRQHPEQLPDTPNHSHYTQSMNKADLVESVQKTLGKETSKALAERAVDAVVEGIKVGLKRGKTVQLVGFGTFKVVQRKARTGVNPKTGEKIKIKASKNVKFGAGKDLKARL